MRYICGLCGAPTDNDQSFEVGGRKYEMHHCDKCCEKTRKELDWKSEGETFAEDEIICPYCGHTYDEYDAYRFEEGDNPKTACESCGKKFDLTITVRRTYATQRSVCEMPADWEKED